MARKLFLLCALILGHIFASSTLAATFVCQPIDVTVYQQRIHVRCSETVDDGADVIRFWAVSTVDAEHANRFLTLGASALVSGRDLVFSYTPGDTSGVSFGCQASDCRVPSAITLS